METIPLLDGERQRGAVDVNHQLIREVEDFELFEIPAHQPTQCNFQSVYGRV